MNFAAGYVGSAEDSVRIRRQEKEREKERKKYEAAAAEKHREAQQAGLKQFAATTTEVRGARTGRWHAARSPTARLRATHAPGTALCRR